MKVLFQFWAKQKYGSNHRIESKTKVYQNVSEYVLNLTTGFPLVKTSKGIINKKYYDSLKYLLKDLPNREEQISNFIHKVWTTREILNVLERISNELDQSISLPNVFWVPLTVHSTKGYSLFSVYALNESNVDEYNSVVTQFYDSFYANDVHPIQIQKEIMLLKNFVSSKNVPLSEVKHLVSWYNKGQEEQYVKQAGTFTRFLEVYPQIARFHKNSVKSTKSKNSNAYVSESFRNKLKNVDVFEI